MFKRKPLSVAVQRAAYSVAVAVTAAIPTVGQAQEQLEEVVVTGSRIGTTDPNLITSSPVTTVKPEEFGFRGITRVEDLLNDLPSITPEFSSNESNGATGTATVDLRGLGSARTLTLTNGHRMGFGDPFVLSPDINQVPSALIERVELLTGGASSTYGSDALAGVVNFIMKKDFEGVIVDFQYSAYQHNEDNEAVRDLIDARGFEQADDSAWDGDTYNIDLVMGVNTPDGKGNITAYVSYRNIDPVFQADRDFSACALGSGGDPVGLSSCAGSATSPTGLFTPFDGVNYFTVAGDEFVFGVPRFNYAPLNHFQRPDERYTAGLFGHYEVNQHLDAYTEFQFMDDRSFAQIAPSGAFFVTNEISCDNPFLSAQQIATIQAGGFACVPGQGDVIPWYIGRRNVEGGPRFDDLRHTSYRILGGVRGEITEDWTYDAFANFSRMIYAETYFNDLSITRITRALDVVSDPVTGSPVCQSVLDGSDSNCVPWNIFQEGGVTGAAIDYLSLPLFSKAQLDQDQFVAFVSGDLTNMGIVSPYASDGVQIVLGGEYRDESVDFEPDQGFQSGDGAGQGGPVAPVFGELQVAEFFTELKVPIIQDRPWFQSLTGDFGYRFSDYDTGVTTDTYKAIGEWTPVQGVKLRGGYSRAVRHANIGELFEPQNFGLWGGVDPCAGPSPELTQAQCVNTGLAPALFGNIPLSPAQQYNALFGGNSDLDPEKSNSFTVGAVFTPEEYIPGLQVSIDYWSVEVKDAIAIIDPQTIVTQCGLTADPGLCSLVSRSPLGSLWIGDPGQIGSSFVQSTQVNIGFFDVSGIDFLGVYAREIGNYGSLDFIFRGTWLEKFDQEELPGAGVDECAGFWNNPCGRPRPEWRHNFGVVWTSPWNLTFSGTWRHIGSVDEIDRDRFSADEENYLDLAVVYTPTFINFGETRLTMGVSNVTDNDPPVNGTINDILPFGNGNTVPNLWDALGRYFFFGVNQSF